MERSVKGIEEGDQEIKSAERVLHCKGESMERREESLQTCVRPDETGET